MIALHESSACAVPSSFRSVPPLAASEVPDSSFSSVPPFPEKTRLSLDPARAAATLGWRMRLPMEEAAGLTADWAKAQAAGADMAAFSRRQLDAFAALAAAA